MAAVDARWVPGGHGRQQGGRLMAPHAHRAPQLAALVVDIHEGRIGRRAFISRALALGLSLSAGEAIFRTYRAGAQEQAENPITVTVGGTPIAAMEEDLSNAAPGGIFRFGRGEESDNLDPVTTGLNTSIWFFMSIYDQLIRVGADGISLAPSLAENWEISDDGLTYTFHLRPNVLFSDGTPMTSADVLYSWVRAANDPEQHWTFTLTALKRDADGQVEGISAPDDSTIVVELAQPWSPFLSDVAMFNLSVVSKAFAEGQEERLVQECMGTGPFALGEWKKGESLSLVKNTHYWEEGLPLLDEVLVQLVPDDNARILQLQGGELDGMKDVPSSRVPELQLDPNLKVYQFPSTYTQYIVLNTREAPLDDAHARLALQYATDRQTLIDVVLFGVGIPATSFMPKGALYWNDTLPGFPYDPAKAREELAQSKTPEGFPLELKVVGGSADDQTLATALKDMWSQIGVDVTIAPTETSVFNEDFWSANFQAMSNYFTYDIIDPDEIVGFSVLPESSQAFQTGWANPEAQELARQGAAETDSAKREEIYFRIQELYNQDSPMVILYHKPYIDLTTTRVHNFSHPPTGQYVFTKTWIEQ
jgi:peptide/nickel transport system substrate-binding protein